MAALLTTKLYIPPLPSTLVKRPRFHSALGRAFGFRLILVTAPAGFGKTTLLSCWLQPFDGDTVPEAAWLSLDERDNDLQRFWEYLVTALTQVGLKGEEQLFALLYQADTVDESFFTALINQVHADIPKHFLLVLDDYHSINSDQIHHGMAFLLEHMPPQMHLVISGRIDPPIPLAGLRARGQLLEIGSDDLRFTLDETDELVRQVKGIELTPSALNALNLRTEGWVAGIQLAAISLRDCLEPECFLESFTGSMRYIGDYLAEQVLEQLDPVIQEFLLDTSILETLNGSLCDAVTLRADGQRMLERLEKQNLFIVALADDRKWFRYHPLMTEFLLERLRRDRSKHVQTLHSRAANWYAQNGMIEEAVEHALEARNYALAVRLIGRLREQIRMHSRVRTLLNWMRALPEDLIRSKPHLCMGYAWVLAIRGYFDEVDRLIESVEAELKRGAQHGDQNLENNKSWPYSLRGVRADLNILRAFMARFGRNPGQAIVYSNRALEIIPADSPRDRGVALLFRGHACMLEGNFDQANQDLLEAVSLCRSASHIVGSLSALHYLAQMRLMQGYLPLALAQYRQAQSYLSEQRQPVYAGIDHVGMGNVYREWNDLESAERHLREGVRLAEVGGDFVFLRDAYIARSQFEFGCGDIDAALESIRKAEAVIQRSAEGWDQRTVQAWRARYWIAQGDLAAASFWVEQSGLDPQAHPKGVQTIEYLTLARCLLAQGRPRQAKSLLERMLQSAEAQERLGHALEIRILLGCALDALGDRKAALRCIKKAIVLAESQGYVRIFVDEGLPVARLLHQLAVNGSNGQSTYIELLLDAYGNEILKQIEEDRSTRSKSATEADGLLSERELQVLALIEKGFSYREIAGDLVIALSTVQTHVKNVYSKLNAHSGIEAVTRARELNLMT
jgi:LuxR family maltose regulon positive regulatory protein